MGKGVGPHNGLAGGDGDAGDAGEQLAGLVDLLGMNAGLGAVEAGACMKRHDNLLQAGVAGPLADAVDRALHLGGPGPDAGEGIGDCHPQIVVAVGGEVHVLHTPDVFLQIAEQVVHLLRRTVANGVRNVQYGGPGLHSNRAALRQKLPVGARAVLGGKLNIVTKALGVGHALPNALKYLFPGHPQLIFHVDFTGCDEEVDAGMLRLLQGVPGGVDISLSAAGQAGHGAVLDCFCNGLHTLGVLGGHNGEARLNYIHAQSVQLPCHVQLFREVHAAAGGLLAIPERGVKYLDPSHLLLTSLW